VTDPLQSFLRATDLDDLMRAHGELTAIPAAPAHEEVVLGVLQEWRDIQAVSNLLFHPQIIPAARRWSFLLKALEQREAPYLILASVVGLPSAEFADLSTEDQSRVLDLLFEVLALDRGVLASRASVKVGSLVDEKHEEKLVALLDHPNDTVRQNILVCLVRLFGLDRAERMLSESETSSRHKTELATLIQRDRDREAEGSFPLLAGPLYSYIPNLADCQ